MNGWQVELMVANAASELWESLNEPDALEKELKEAAKELKKGAELIDEGLDRVSDSIAILSETPMADKLQGILETFEGLLYEIGQMRDHFERGERE